MPKYRVYAHASVSWLIGEYEADNAEAAIEVLQDDEPQNWMQLGSIVRVER